MKKQILISELQRAILSGKKRYGKYILPSPQRCGTGYQRLTHALLMAQKLIG